MCAVDSIIAAILEMRKLRLGDKQLRGEFSVERMWQQQFSITRRSGWVRTETAVALTFRANLYGFPYV